jgi:predicted O-linked N-acetylglucosamine transferase (SPINDLY family)
VPFASREQHAALFRHGFALHQQGDLSQAADAYRKVLAVQPGHFDALHCLGIICLQRGDPQQALDLIGRAITVNAAIPEAHSNLGIALSDLRRPAEAVQSYDKAIALKPDYADAHNNRGNALNDLGQPREALQSFDRAIALKPDSAEAHKNRGNALAELGRHEEALQGYDQALALKPDLKLLYGQWLTARMNICDWRGADRAFAGLAERVARGATAAAPFGVLAVSNSAALQRRVAELYVNDRFPAAASAAPVPRYAGHDRIRVGYFSADFRNHAVASLIAGLFERHDRGKVEPHAFSFGPRTDDEMQKRLMAGVDSFVDVRAQSDADVAALARRLEIDIAVDLTGFTDGGRLGIFARRAAPIQASYLGYPGTSGAAYIDYLIADPTLVPDVDRPHYSEKIVYLPDSYQVNDSTRRISDRTVTREDAGLPPSGFVFCCFNKSHKILPETFDGWMRILGRVPGSVLWLLRDNDAATRNLRREAVARGVAADRLVFADRIALAEHWARHRLAGLFLDTLPYNAHTTASDALWAGLPVLTRIGETFAGRVGASLLNAINLPELIVRTQQDYEDMAVGLATNPERLAQIGRKLARNRLAMPLFDTALFARRLEQAYAMMVRRHHDGLPPADLWP